MKLGDLSIRDLAGVAAVAHHRHFGRAAAALRVAQPTLSAQVQKVERLLGAPLFERTGRRFLITDAGDRALPEIRRLLEVAELLEQAVDTDSGRAPLRLGIIPTLGPYLMPHLLGVLRRRTRAPFEIAEHPTARLIDDLHSGVLDAALLSLPIREPALECLPLFDEPFRLIAPKGSDILESKRLAPSRLAACDMILLEEGHCLRDQAIAVCSKRGGTSPRMVTTSLETLKYLVASGSGYSLLPALACDVPKGLVDLVALRDFDDRGPSRRVALCFRKTHPRRADLLELAETTRAALPRGVHPVPPGRSGSRTQ